MRNINYTFIVLCPSRMLEHYFSKGFGTFEQNSNNLTRIENEAKLRINAMDMHDSDYFMTFSIESISILNTL